MTARSRIVAQFKRPNGVLGRMAGWIMANRPSNRERNRWTVSLLEIQSQDVLLEIGFGPGLGVQLASQKASTGLVAGIDYSETMLTQALKRNRSAVEQKRVALKLGSVEDLPSFDRSFDKIFSANVVQFWPDPIENFKALRMLLKSEGTIATTFMPRNKGANKSDSLRMKKKIVSDMAGAGFVNIHVETLPMNPAPAICVLGQNPV